jgi:ferredoxin-type protein NapG
MNDTISRKDFIKSFFSLFSDSINTRAQVQKHSLSGCILPPGAGTFSEFSENCTKCYACVSACPNESLRVFRKIEQDRLYGLPVIDPRIQACYLCRDWPCIHACPDGILSFSDASLRLGTAVIDQNTCLAFNGQYCQSCITNCPFDGNAIFLNQECQPQINEDECRGCGICVQVCPASPEAITIRPVNPTR